MNPMIHLDWKHLEDFISEVEREARAAAIEEAKTLVKKYADQYHGGGNGRRLFIEFEAELENLKHKPQ